MGTLIESGQDKAAKGEGWPPPFISCAQDTVDSNPTVPTAIRLWETFTFFIMHNYANPHPTGTQNFINIEPTSVQRHDVESVDSVLSVQWSVLIEQYGESIICELVNITKCKLDPFF